MSAKTRANKSSGKIYHMWYTMIRRCYNSNDPAYHNYGARGISVCTEWRESRKEFEEFARRCGWARDLQIDRIDNSGNYDPENVRFVATRKNCRNKRNNTLITIGGKTQTLADWAEESGVGRATIGWRYKHGITGKALLVKPDTNAYVTINGVRKSYKEWAAMLSMPTDTFCKRVSDGLTGDALLQPYRKNKTPYRHRAERKEVMPNCLLP